VCVLTGVIGVPACTSAPQQAARMAPTSTTPSLVPTSVPVRPRGGQARVGVWGAPDPAAPTLGGAAVRALVLPQLFVAGPDGTWVPSLVQPGSDLSAGDNRAARFRLRAGATWSNGAPITADDLRRSADSRFVSSVDGPAADGTLTARFTQPLPAWRRLWSGVDSVRAPAPGVWGGPFVVAGSTPGLDIVLHRNDAWWGRPAPYLDEVRLVLVPDEITARQLLGKGELDVVMPPATTTRTSGLRALPGVSVDTSNRGGWSVGLFLPGNRLGRGQREAIVHAVDRQRFVSVLLDGEAVRLDGFAGPEDATWASVRADAAGSWKAGSTVELVGENEEPMTEPLERVLQQRGAAGKASVDLRNAEASVVEGWLAAGAYDAFIAMVFDGPDPCWTCRWSAADGTLARAADAGDRQAAAALEAKLRDQSLVLPLWRPRTVVAFRSGLHGVRANGFGLDGAWNAWEWWRG
jgi:ABC-type transport system substrate-binding protein